MTPQARNALESRIVRRLIREAKKLGYSPHEVHDEDGGVTPTPTESLMGAEVFAQDITTVTFKHPERGVRWFLVILGNGEDCISDHGVHPDADLIAANLYAWIEGLDQPRNWWDLPVAEACWNGDARDVGDR